MIKIIVKVYKNRPRYERYEKVKCPNCNTLLSQYNYEIQLCNNCNTKLEITEEVHE